MVHVLVGALLASVVVILATTPAYADPPRDTPFLTWNMQGATAQGANLWTDYFPSIVNDASATNPGAGYTGPQVVMLQEVGAGPPETAEPLANPTNDPLASYYRWAYPIRGANDDGYWYMLFLQTNDPTAPGGRVNTIVMSRTRPTGFMTVNNPLGNNRGRSAPGIQEGDDFYFSFHALSGGGGDAVGMLDAIGTAVEARQPAGRRYDWTVGADFNTPPNTLARRPDFPIINAPNGRPTIVASGQVTQRSGRELDYAVTTTGNGNPDDLNDPDNPAHLVASARPSRGGSDHQPVFVRPRTPRPAPSTRPNYVYLAMAVGGYVINGVNQPNAPYNSAGMRNVLRACALAYGPPCGSGGSGAARSPDAAPNAAPAADGVSFDYVGAVSGGTVDGGDNQEEAFPGQSVDQLRQHLVTDLRTYKPNVVLLQIDVANDLVTHSGLTVTQEATALRGLLDQVFYVLPNTTVLVGDPTPSTRPAVEDAMYTGSGSYVAQSDRIVSDAISAGHQVRKVTLDFEHDTSYLDTGQPVDGLPNAKGYSAMAADYAGPLRDAQQNGTITDPGGIVVNPADIIEDGSGIDDTGHAGGGSTTGPPCDIYGSFGTPCVEAVSTTRALYSTYNGPLYQVQRASDRTTTDIGVLAAGGYADAAGQDSFCANTTCVITRIYDQSSLHNDLTVEGKGSAGAADHPADAAALPVTIAGHKVYGIDVVGQTGYRNNATHGIATTDAPEGMYMVASGTHVNAGCCFDFGNAEPSVTDTRNGAMDAVNLGTKCYFPPCSGSGPWVEADLENGLFSGANGSNPANKGNGTNFVTAVLKNDGKTTYALKGGDAQTGGLTTWWDGDLPDRGGYRPMRKEGAVVLGTGGDNSNASIGSFFEGVMTQGYPSDAADDAVQADITKAGYDGNSAGNELATGTAGPSVTHDGYTSVFSVDAINGHLQETFLDKVGDPWATHDLTDLFKTPRVMPGTQPVAVTHGGFTSVYTIDDSTGDLQETYLTRIGADWITQDLTRNYHTPPSDTTPSAVVHDGYTSLYTIDRNEPQSGDLQETYLSAIGSPWVTQDLTTNYGTPGVLAGTGSVALVHGGFTSVYTVDGNDHHLRETYLPQIGQRWTTQDLTANYHTPPTVVTPAAAVHSDYTSVYTVDDGNGHLQETFLDKIGDRWATQDLTANFHTPPVTAGTQPVALFHTGYISVYTVGNGDLQETFLDKIGDDWATQDLSAKYHTPPTVTTPIALVHPAPDGSMTFSSVYTVNQFNNHLQETYLDRIGNPWVTQDLSYNYHTPPVLVSSAPIGQSGYTRVYSVDQSNNHLQETFLDKIGDNWATHDLTDLYQTPPVREGSSPSGVIHDGYASVFTVDANGHLWETYLDKIGDRWIAQDLSAKYQTPAVAPSTSATAIYHRGYTSVYTVDAGSGHLQETYLSGLGAPWITQDLTVKYGTPAVAASTSPAAVVHSDWASVYTVDAADHHLQETYLSYIGASWISQDLTAKYGTPAVAQNSSPDPVVHSGWTSVYTLDPNHHLQETYLSAIGNAWVTQDLSARYGVPDIAGNSTPSGLYHTGYTSVYTVNAANHHVQETYLAGIGGSWVTQDLANYGTPATDQVPLPSVHYARDGGLTFTSIYTVDSSDHHLRETYLDKIGNPWITQDMTAKYGTPPVR